MRTYRDPSEENLQAIGGYDYGARVGDSKVLRYLLKP